MRGGRLGVALLALLVVAAGCLSGLPGFDEGSTPDLQTHQAHNVTIPGQGGIAIATTVFKPAGASPEDPAGAPVDLALFEDLAAPLTLAGIPQVNLTVTAGAANTIYLSLVKTAPSSAGAGEERVVLDSQVVPIRFQGPAQGEELSLDLGGVASEIPPGDRLYLRVSNWNEQYATNAERVPGAVTITGIEVHLPILDDGST